MPEGQQMTELQMAEVRTEKGSRAEIATADAKLQSCTAMLVAHEIGVDFMIFMHGLLLDMFWAV